MILKENELAVYYKKGSNPVICYIVASEVYGNTSLRDLLLNAGSLAQFLRECVPHLTNCKEGEHYYRLYSEVLADMQKEQQEEAAQTKDVIREVPESDHGKILTYREILTELQTITAKVDSMEKQVNDLDARTGKGCIADATTAYNPYTYSFIKLHETK